MSVALLYTKRQTPDTKYSNFQEHSICTILQFHSGLFLHNMGLAETIQLLRPGLETLMIIPQWFGEIFYQFSFPCVHNDADKNRII